MYTVPVATEQGHWIPRNASTQFVLSLTSEPLRSTIDVELSSTVPAEPTVVQPVSTEADVTPSSITRIPSTTMAVSRIQSCSMFCMVTSLRQSGSFISFDETTNN